MANQPGFNTLVSLEKDIILATKNNVINFSGLLFQHNLIDGDQYGVARNTRNPANERARDVMDVVRGKVEEDDSLFETLLTIFDSDRAQNKVIISKLRETYKEKGSYQYPACAVLAKPL